MAEGRNCSQWRSSGGLCGRCVGEHIKARCKLNPADLRFLYPPCTSPVTGACQELSNRCRLNVCSRAWVIGAELTENGLRTAYWYSVEAASPGLSEVPPPSVEKEEVAREEGQ